MPCVITIDVMLKDSDSVRGDVRCEVCHVLLRREARMFVCGEGRSLNSDRSSVFFPLQAFGTGGPPWDTRERLYKSCALFTSWTALEVCSFGSRATYLLNNHAGNQLPLSLASWSPRRNLVVGCLRPKIGAYDNLSREYLSHL